MDLVTSSFRVEGRVQGVGFRAFCQSLAIRTGVNGEVWNTRGGGVEGVVQASQDQHDEFLRKLREGPGRVDTVNTETLSPTERFTEFSIRHTR